MFAFETHSLAKSTSSVITIRSILFVVFSSSLAALPKIAAEMIRLSVKKGLMDDLLTGRVRVKT